MTTDYSTKTEKDHRKAVFHREVKGSLVIRASKSRLQTDGR